MQCECGTHESSAPPFPTPNPGGGEVGVDGDDDAVQNGHEHAEEVERQALGDEVERIRGLAKRSEPRFARTDRSFSLPTDEAVLDRERQTKNASLSMPPRVEYEYEINQRNDTSVNRPNDLHPKFALKGGTNKPHKFGPTSTDEGSHTPTTCMELFSASTWTPQLRG